MPQRSIETIEPVGGSLALDFANTVSSPWPDQGEQLEDYQSFLGWAEQIGVLDRTDREELARRARADPAGAGRVVRDAHRRRAAIRTVFATLAAGQSPSAGDASEVMAGYAEALMRATTDATPHGAQVTWTHGSLDRPLDPIAYDAGRLLLSPDAGLVKECDACPWLFIDRSRNHSRRWCDMQICGSRTKMRRYYASNRRGPSL